MCCCLIKQERSRSVTGKQLISILLMESMKMNLFDLSALSSLSDDTPEGKSIVELALQKGVQSAKIEHGMSIHQVHCRNKKQRC